MGLAFCFAGAPVGLDGLDGAVVVYATGEQVRDGLWI